MFKVPSLILDAREADFGGNVDELTLEAFPDARLQELGNPRTRWKREPGAGGVGVVAYAALEYDPVSGRMVVFGAMKGAKAKKHQHIRKIGGNGNECEDILTVAGRGKDVLDATGQPIDLMRGIINSHAVNTVHEPGTDPAEGENGWWVFVYRNYGTIDWPPPARK